MHRLIISIPFLLELSMASTIAYDCQSISNNVIFGSTLCGAVIFPTDSDFVTNSEQYAYYAFPEQFSPSMLVIADCDEDIKVTLEFALQCDYKVSIRSGGHQFSGLSSCNSDDYDCIQLILKNYDELQIYTNNNTAIAEVGVRITDLYSTLDEHGLFIPGAAESSVALGGMCQTGGIGFIMRQFGLFIDMVYAFDLMMYNGSIIHSTEFNEYADVFWAVLGGGPGNWGVILRLHMNVLSNSDYPNAVAVSYAWPYTQETAEETALTWLELENGAMGEHRDTLILWGIVPNFEFNIHMVVLSFLFIEDVDGEGRTWDNYGYDALLKPFDDLNITGAFAQSVIDNESVSSHLAGQFLFPSELIAPYEYSMKAHATTAVWTEQFIYDLIDASDELINDAVNEAGVNLQLGYEVLFEMYGGAFEDVAAERTSLAWRDTRHGTGARVFYKDDAAKQVQADWVEKTWKLWKPKHFNNEEIRYYGYTFYTEEEGEFDMETQWQYYYRTQERYDRLKSIKQSMDPCDIFHFSFSIPVDDTSNCPRDSDSESEDAAMIQLKSSVLLIYFVFHLIVCLYI